LKVVVTGSSGLLGTHAAIHLHAQNCAARFRGEAEPFDLVCLDHAAFADARQLQAALSDADAVLHFAGVNRGSDAEVEAANPAIAQALVDGCRAAGCTPHIVHANSIHAGADTPYGRSKAEAHRVLTQLGGTLTNLVLAHVFGEGARPRYNNVAATLIEALLDGKTPQINPEGQVHLLHAGAVAEAAITAARNRQTSDVKPPPRTMRVPALWEKLKEFHDSYRANIFPDLSDGFDVALFNSYRAATYPGGWPRPLRLNTDARGTLFEAVKGGGGGQCFMSTTMPGVTRGDHFHLTKVERFLVVEGQATIRMRKVLGDDVLEYKVTGAAPAPVDMPTLYTHSIENTGDGPLLTLFWTHDLFDPENPDTFADKVLS